jgi:hypothetical protein
VDQYLENSTQSHERHRYVAVERETRCAGQDWGVLCAAHDFVEEHWRHFNCFSLTTATSPD